MHYGKKAWWKFARYDALGNALGSGIHVDFTLLCTAYLNRPNTLSLIMPIFPDGIGLYQQDNAPWYTAEIFQRNKSTYRTTANILVPDLTWGVNKISTDSQNLCMILRTVDNAIMNYLPMQWWTSPRPCLRTTQLFGMLILCFQINLFTCAMSKSGVFFSFPSPFFSFCCPCPNFSGTCCRHQIQNE